MVTTETQISDFQEQMKLYLKTQNKSRNKISLKILQSSQIKNIKEKGRKFLKYVILADQSLSVSNSNQETDRDPCYHHLYPNRKYTKT
jgi:hypothetical protein